MVLGPVPLPIHFLLEGVAGSTEDSGILKAVLSSEASGLVQGQSPPGKVTMVRMPNICECC